MAALTFTYPITRPYPFWWFKWAVLVGGICVIVTFSILNFAANGYVLAVQYTTYPNVTTSKKIWTQNLPFSFNGNMASSCQSQNLGVNTQYYTDKLSLVYSLANIWQVQDNGKVVTLPSLPYMYNPLENCTVTLVQLDFSNYDGRTAAQLGWTTWGMTALGMLTCQVNNDHRPTWLNLTVNYEFVPMTIDSGAAFQFLQAPNNETQASLWWGESLLSWYWLNFIHKTANQSTLSEDGTSTNNLIKGTIVLWPSYNVTDITSLDFFRDPGFHFVINEMQDNGAVLGEPRCCYLIGGDPSINGLHNSGVRPDIWIEADSFAKVFYSTILADLGQNSMSNVVMNSTALTTFSQNISNMAGVVETKWLKAGPARTPYNEGNAGAQNLAVNSSVFYTQYFCQIPTLKSTGSLIIAVLTADIVFLHAAWAILNWATATILKMRDPTANSCHKCNDKTEETVELMDLPERRGSMEEGQASPHEKHTSYTVTDS